MADETSNLGLYLPGGGSTGEITPDEYIDVDKISHNFEILDGYVGAVQRDSDDMPEDPRQGLIVFQKDKKKLVMFHNTDWVTLHSDYDSGDIDMPVKAAKGWKVTDSRGRKFGTRWVSLFVKLERTGGKINIGTSGNIANQHVATIQDEQMYDATSEANLSSIYSGDAAVGSIKKGTDIHLTAVSYRSGGITKGKTYSLAGMWFTEKEH